MPATKEATTKALYPAFDLHSNISVLDVVDQAGDLRYRRQLPNDLPLIDEALTPFRDELRDVAVESTYKAHWLIDSLQKSGLSSTDVQYPCGAAVRRPQTRRRRQ